MGLVALTFILVSVSNARNAFWEDPSGNSMFDPYEFVPAPRTPVESWERDRECDADYFEFTHENLHDSGVSDWYPVFIDKLRTKYASDYAALGEVRFFSKYGWGDSNFVCGTLQKGCTTLPSAKTIMERVTARREGSNFTIAENLSETRRIYFMASEIKAISSYFYYQMVRLN